MPAERKKFQIIDEAKETSNSALATQDQKQMSSSKRYSDLVKPFEIQKRQIGMGNERK
jgi:hypothetical protein